MRLKLISCEVLFREMCDACAHTPNQVDVEFLPKGLHDMGSKGMLQNLQHAVDATPQSSYEAILLGYGLCGNGLDGLTARHTRLVLPRAHDCIALLMGSVECHQRYFENNPGTYYRSTGWLERGRDLRQLNPHPMGFDESLEAMIKKYGEDNGRYLFEELTRYQQQYRKLAFLESGLEADGAFAAEAAAEASSKGWTFERLPADLSWVRRMLDGKWDGAEFVVAEPGQRIAACYDGSIVQVKPA